MKYVSLVSMFIFILLLLAGGLLTTRRECLPRHVSENAVCVPCEDEFCTDCSKGSTSCQACAEGSVLLSNGTCLDCNKNDPIGLCNKCSFDEILDQTTCLECKGTYGLVNGQCQHCSAQKYCAKCDDQKCSQCLEGAFFDRNGNCNSCAGKLKHCRQCNEENKCDICDIEVATMDSEGKCSICNEQTGDRKSVV